MMLFIFNQTPYTLRALRNAENEYLKTKQRSCRGVARDGCPGAKPV